MITNKSRKREIRDLQRLLMSVGLMEFASTTTSGEWGDETQAAVLRAYTTLGWDHPADGRWITTPALAALTSALHSHTIDGSNTPTSPGTGAGGSHTGAGGSHTGAGGSHTGAGGSHTGAGGSHTGAGGSHTGAGPDIE
jgi:hypothetical protein